ncbi:MAG: GGDEF domain-containing protein [Beijerinckiaceae bacterium]|nr:GGDEF domain-containing protein [Beijerinckiaceae bacterium]
MGLSIATLFIAYTLICASMAFYFIVTWLGQRERAIYLWMGLSAASGTAGLVAFMFRTPESGGLLVWAAWVFFIQSMAFWWTAVRHVDRKSHPPWAVSAGTVIWTIVFLVMPKDTPETVRNTINTALIAGYSLAMSFEMIRGVGPKNRSEGARAISSRLMAAITMFAHSCMCLSALVCAMIRAELFLPAIEKDTWTSLSFLEAMIVYIIMALTLSTLELDNEAMHQRHMATTDFLTGILTRRAFLDRAANLLAKAPRDVALLVFDLDHFKTINDTFGHATGDIAIQAFTSEVRDHLAKLGDVARVDPDLEASKRGSRPVRTPSGGRVKPSLAAFGRLGGEEFACILPHASSAQAMRLAEDIQTSLARKTFSVASGDVRMTVSVGVVARSDIDQDIYAMLHVADKALYSAKRSGRNRVACGQAILGQPLGAAS